MGAIWYRQRLLASQSRSTKCRCKERKEGGVVVDVVAGKPGIMIGRAGKDIEALSGYVAKWMECPVKINIQEFDPMK